MTMGTAQMKLLAVLSINAPSDTGDGHQGGAQRIGGRQTRRDQVDETGHGDRETEPRQHGEVLAAAQRHDEHRELHRAEQDKGTGTGTERRVRE